MGAVSPEEERVANEALQTAMRMSQPHEGRSDPMKVKQVTRIIQHIFAESVRGLLETGEFSAEEAEEGFSKALLKTLYELEFGEAPHD